MGEDEKTEEAKEGKLTVKPLGTYVVDGLTKPISVEGQAPTSGADVVVKPSYSNEAQHAVSGPDGHYGANVLPPTTPGPHTISVESSGQTTSTPLIAKPKQEP